MANIELTLILPGLASILSQDINRAIIPTYFTKLIGKAMRIEHPIGLSRSLFNHFSDKPLTGSDLPVCDLSNPKGMMIKADPCYLYADRDRLLLFAKSIKLTEQESAELIDEIQPLLSDIGTLKQLTPESWALELKQKPDIQLSALAEVEGRGVEGFLPVGKDRKKWVSLWNEIQMQLYNSDLNQHRIASQQMPINSLWFWGMGSFLSTNKRWATISGQSTLLSQLATINHADYYQITPPAKWSVGQNLWLLDEVDIESDWQGGLDKWDKTIFEPIWQQLSKASIDKVILQIPDYAEYHITPFRRWRFWT